MMYELKPFQWNAHSPTRIDLVGGTLDLWPITAFLKKTATVNVAIDIYTRAQLKKRDDRQIILHSPLKVYSFSALDEFFAFHDDSLAMVQEVCDFFRPQWGFELSWSSSSPVGGGLGGSSSLMVTLLKVFKEAMGVQHTFSEWVNIAHNLEARLLRTPTGTQDYCPAWMGGLCIMEYSDVGLNVTQYSPHKLSLPGDFFLVHTGVSHHSGLNNFDVLQRLIQGDDFVWEAIHHLNQLALQVAYQLKNDEPVDWLKVFQEEYKFRVRLSPHFTSPQIEHIKNLIELEMPKRISGYGWLKILGAGGGGHVAAGWIGGQSRVVKKTLMEAGFTVREFNFAALELSF